MQCLVLILIRHRPVIPLPPALLHVTQCPKTCENFRQFCTGEFTSSQFNQQPTGYKNSTFHRIIKDFVSQSSLFLTSGVFFAILAFRFSSIKCPVGHFSAVGFTKVPPFFQSCAQLNSFHTRILPFFHKMFRWSKGATSWIMTGAVKSPSMGPLSKMRTSFISTMDQAS